MTSEEASMFAAGLAAFVLGACLARFNVLSIIVATIFSTAASFVLSTFRGWTIFDSVLVSLTVVLALQTGYLISHLLRSSRK
jgi:hypothetical protein